MAGRKPGPPALTSAHVYLIGHQLAGAALWSGFREGLWTPLCIPERAASSCSPQLCQSDSTVTGTQTRRWALHCYCLMTTGKKKQNKHKNNNIWRMELCYHLMSGFKNWNIMPVDTAGCLRCVWIASATLYNAMLPLIITKWQSHGDCTTHAGNDCRSKTANREVPLVCLFF